MGIKGVTTKLVFGFMGLYLAVLIGAPRVSADTFPPWLTERRIHGANGLEPIESLRSDPTRYEKTRVVARVESSDGAGFCTASRVGNDLFLSNFHCYEFKPCQNMQFHLGYEKDVPKASQLIFKCKEVLAKNKTHDFALFRAELGKKAGGGAIVTNVYGDKSLHVDIPDNDPHGLSQGLDIVNGGRITDVKVHVIIKHPFLSDIEVVLTSPAGTSIKLHDHASGADLDRTYTFDDGLSALEGQTAKGKWLLRVADLSPGDSGTLEGFVLTLTTEVPAPAESGDANLGGELAVDDYPIATFYTGQVAVGQKLLVAGHPSARQKEMDRSDECVLRTIAIQIEEERETITHLCDTEGGSSGSPVMDRETGRIVGLHWGGNGEYNFAIPIAKVISDLKAALTPTDFGQLRIESDDMTNDTPADKPVDKPVDKPDGQGNTSAT